MSRDENGTPDEHETPISGAPETSHTPASERADADAVTPETGPVEASEPAASTEVTLTGAVATQRALVREKAQQVKAQQRRMRWVRRSAVGIVVVAAVAAIAVVVTTIVSGAVTKPQLSPPVIEGDGIVVTPAGTSFPGQSLPSEEETPTATPAPTETAATPTPTPTPDPVEIVVYVDYLSPESAVFQLNNSGQLAELIRMESVTVTYHPVAMLAAKSNGTKYSQRAAAAAACVAAFSPDTFYAFNHELFAQQPEQDDDGPSDEVLADIAIAVGSRGADGLRVCIEKGTYLSWAASATDRALESPMVGTELVLTQTPTILIDGVPYIGALDNPPEFLQAVMTAESSAFYSTPTATPTPEATPTPTPTDTTTPAATPAPSATPTTTP